MRCFAWRISWLSRAGRNGANPIRVYTKLTLDMNTPLPGGRFEIVQEESYEYDGPVVLAKKGRAQADAAAKGGVKLGDQASGIATTNQGIQSGYRTAGDTAAKTYFAQPTDPSGLTARKGCQSVLASTFPIACTVHLEV
jgi:hypothetical protein